MSNAKITFISIGSTVGIAICGLVWHTWKQDHDTLIEVHRDVKNIDLRLSRIEDVLIEKSFGYNQWQKNTSPRLSKSTN